MITYKPLLITTWNAQLGTQDSVSAYPKTYETTYPVWTPDSPTHLGAWPDELHSRWYGAPESN